ncbi:DMT family transporter [Kaistia defluvii]|uniref:DMT family transporter n=1 Tax=Kaistia defluvii TaxID=410841 RepID=UPI002255D277|nr:DMT family transporter [Kaistia defluvii]MCX5517637.1 DMT family transporter [Kaistia defluvii]
MSSPLPTADAEATLRLRGIAMYSLAMFLFAGTDACAKYAGQFVPVMEVVWLRFVVQIVLAVLVFQPWRAIALYKTRRPGMQFLRGMFLAGSTVFNFLAVHELQLDQTMSIGFSAPFITAALAGPLLGEWAGPRRWAAILVGFVGVLVITMPGFGSLKPAMFLSLAAASSNAFYILSTRLLTRTDSSAGLLLYSGLIPALVLSPVAVPMIVAPPTLLVGVCMFLTGALAFAGHWCLVHAHKQTAVPVLAPFMYTGLIWMILLGYLVFNDVPAPRTLVGASIIIASGLYLLYRERVKAPKRQEPVDVLDG